MKKIKKKVICRICKKLKVKVRNTVIGPICTRCLKSISFSNGPVEYIKNITGMEVTDVKTN